MRATDILYTNRLLEIATEKMNNSRTANIARNICRNSDGCGSESARNHSTFSRHLPSAPLSAVGSVLQRRVTHPYDPRLSDYCTCATTWNCSFVTHETLLQPHIYRHYHLPSRLHLEPSYLHLSAREHFRFLVSHLRPSS